MQRTCIAVVDASRARLFTFERSNDVEGLNELLVEERDLVNPARHRKHAELDDRRDQYIHELDAEFSRSVIGELLDLSRAAHANRVILCASPHMLGELRDAGRNLPRDITIDELARDFVKLTPPQLREHLESHGLLPAQPTRGGQ
jgi:protein required for attachment to host cells